MSFVGRARSSFERGDTLRAVLTLVAGLRRTPNHPEALELLVTLVRDEVESGGIEHEIAQVLTPHPKRNELLSEMLVGLRGRDQDRVADRLLLEAKRRGMVFIAPADPDPDPDPEPPVEAVEESDDVDRDREDSADDESSDETPRPDTSSRERDRRQELAAAAEERLAQRKREATRQRQAELAAKRRRRSVQLVVVALVLGIGLVGVYVAGAASRSADLTTLEAELHRFNRFDAEALDAVSAAASTRDDAEFQERLAFARALSGTPTEEASLDWQTSWGLGAAVVSALQRDDVESALALVTKLERTQPDSLGAQYARALLEEHRGNTEEARSAAMRLIDRYAAFVPAHEVVVRTAARQLQLDVLDAARTGLREIAPSHPYAGLTIVSLRDLLLLPEAATTPPGDAPVEDRFARAVRAYQQAVSAAAKGNEVEAAAHAERALALDDKFLPARLVLAVARLNNGEVERAADEFLAASEAARTTEVRLLIQAAAPLGLAAAGRADLGVRYTTPYPKLRAKGVDDRFDEEVGTTRPESLRKSALPDVASTPWASEALYARAYLRAEKGEQAAAAAMYSDLRSRNIAPGRAAALLASVGSGTPQNTALTAMVEDFAAGHFWRVAAAAEEPPAWASSLHLSLRVRSLLALGAAGQANALVEQQRVGSAREPQRDVLRLLVAAHFGRGNIAFEKLLKRHDPETTTSATVALTVAEALFWQRRFNDAEVWLQRAEKIGAPSYEMAWVCGLVNLGRSRDEEAAECLAASGRASDAVADVQAALGFIQLKLGRSSKAVERFEAALEQDGTNAATARGLGAALYAAEGRGARTEIDRARQGLDGPARAELDRWYAVARGLRKGEDDAVESFDAAVAILGSRADLMAERARFHAAREEWDTAAQLYEGALRRDDTLDEAHVALARLLIRDGRAAEARPHLERYLELEPQGPSAAWARKQLE